MKIALITTTVNKPTVLELYRQHGPDVRFFVAGDRKTPQEAADWCHDLAGTTYLSPEMQQSFEYKCSELISWNCIQRRNIALLEAVKWGAEIIISIDDDNAPMDKNYFDDFFKHWWFAANTALAEDRKSIFVEHKLEHASFSGLKVSGTNRWFDVGNLLDPVSSHRGFPFSRRSDSWRVEHVTNVKIGVAAGICLGDPDISASTRIERAPEVHRVSQLLKSGVVVDASPAAGGPTCTVFNSQNTAFIRELAPAMFMMPGVGRMDDIYASLIAQKIMHSRGLHVHFGRPFVWQQRNPHNLVRDLRQEIDGMENVEKLQKYLATNVFVVEGAAVLEELRAIYAGFDKLPNSYDIVPKESVAAALAFLGDIERVI